MSTTFTVLTATLNDWELVETLLPRIDQAMIECDADCTVVVVDDGSTSLQAREQCKTLSFERIKKVISVDLHRNMGNQRALAVGMAYVSKQLESDYVAVLDSDHEDNPDYLPEMLRACREKEDQSIVFAARTKRSEGKMFTVFYRLYQWVYRWLTGTPISMGNFSVIPFHLARRLAYVTELWAHFPASIVKARIPYDLIQAERGKRPSGESKMNLIGLIGHAINGFSVHAEAVSVRIILFIMINLGLISLLAVIMVLLKLFTDIPILGWTSQILLILFAVFVQLGAIMVYMSFMFSMQRSVMPIIPADVYLSFINKEETLYPAG